MRTLTLLALGALILAGCVTTKRSTVSGFNDGHDTWRHTNETTEKTRTTSGETEQHTFTDGLIASGAGASAGWVCEKTFTSITGSNIAGVVAKQVGKRVVSFIVAELLNGPPPAMQLGPLPTSGEWDDVHGLVFSLDFPWDMPWMQDERQSGFDARGLRDLTLRLRVYGGYVDVRLTQDSNATYGWVSCTPFSWPRGKPIRLAVYDADVSFDDGMVDFEVPDVNYYYELWAQDGDKSYRVGKVGFLSQSDVALMQESYPELRVSPN